MSRATSPRSPFAPSLGPLALALLVLFGAAFAAAAPRPDRSERSRARLVSPAPGERLAETAITFAFERPGGASEYRLVLAPRAFDTAGWTALPAAPDFVVRDASHGALKLTETGVTIASETTWWWTVAAKDAATGSWVFGETRSFVAIPRFANRVSPSPYLPGGVIGSLPPAELRAERAASRTAASETAPAVPHLRLAAGYDFVPGAGAPALAAELTLRRAPAEESGGAMQSVLVQFAAPPSDADLRELAAAGAKVIAYVPDQAYLVRMSGDARARFAATAKAAWIGDWQPAYKLSPRADRLATATSSYEALLFPDADLSAASVALAAAGFEVTAGSDNGLNRLVRFRGSGDRLADAAALPAIEWIEPLVLPTVENDNAQWVVQTSVNGSRRVWDMGIKGEAQVVMTSDTGIHVAHDQFRDPSVALTTWGDYPTHRKVIAYKMGSNNPSIEFDDHAGASYHGTHTAGTLIGSDDPVGNASLRDGMAKNGKIYFMDISGTALGNTVDPFPDLNDLFLPSYLGNAGGAARISSNSWGSSVNGAYTLESYEVDQFMWNHPDYYIAFSNGNSAAVGTVGSPATAKNCAGMGGTGNGTSEFSLYTTTSRGPCLDGRRKPTFCAPGQALFSAYGGSTNSYQSLSGTSMASPSGTGAVVLMRQYLTEGWYPTGAKVPANGFSPSAALLKAMAINSADNNVAGFTAPDNNVGWGRVDADNVLYFSGDSRKLLLEDFTSGLANGQYVEYQVDVVDSLVPLKVSLCWTDFPADPAAATQLVNNLDLTVSKGATVYKGNVFSGGASTTGGSYDAINVEEGVLVSVPRKGLYTVRVAAPTVPMGPQPFGLVVTGGVGNGAGTLAMDRASYGSASTVQLQVIDTNAGPTIGVNVASATEPAGENVTLSGSNGVYTGSLPLAPTLPVAANGVLSVSNGDSLVATYNEASPAVMLLAKAGVDFATPVITNVHAASLGPVGTLVTWTTDRNATSRVDYGTGGALELGSVDSSGYALAHQVLLTNVTPGQSYLYDVESTGLTGGAARDDHGGAHYRFTAKAGGDVLLLLGTPNFDRTFTWKSALGDDGYDYDIWSGSLADNPALGDLNGGLRSYRAVIWQCGPDDYPPVNDVQRAVIDAYLAGGGRLWILGHDLGWGLADPSSPSYNATRAAWVPGTLHANFLLDPTNVTNLFGVGSDPISGPYASPTPVAYQEFGAGQAADEISSNPGTGSASYVWVDDATPNNTTLRWTNGVANGSAGTALWGGQPTRLVSMFAEFTAMRPPFNAADAVRDTVLDRTLNWLFGRAHPVAVLAGPNGGELLTTATANITWTESVAPGLSIASRSIEYSPDGGDSWTTIATGVGPSPYVWDLTSVPNTTHARVRVRLTDNGAPALRAVDASAADFTINRGGGDTQGPVVVAGSIAVNPNPVVRGVNATLSATVSDATTGGAAVTAAEWSFGPSPAPGGSGTPLGGAFGSTTVAASLLLDTQYFVLGSQKLWVRALDAAGNWGPASALTVTVNGTGTTDAIGQPVVSFLAQSAPNPSAAGAATTIRFGLARGGEIALDVFDTQGRRVRRLAGGAFAAGLHQASWDGRDDHGAALGAGLYFYRLVTPEGRFEKRLALLP